MKLVSYLTDGHDQLAFLVDNLLYDCDLLHPELPNSMNMFLHYWDDMFPIAKQVDAAIKSGRINSEKGIAIQDLELLAPVPFPSSCRKEFGFANHHAIQGPGTIKCMPDYLAQLDFVPEAAIVICKHGRNIAAAEADEYIGGLLIMNHLMARNFETNNLQLYFGLAKGKDFAIAIGPCLVTLDELEPFEVPAKQGHTGKSWNLEIKCAVNGEQVSGGNLSDMDWTFAELIERSAYGVNLQPGDIISSGAVCAGFNNINNVKAANNDHQAERWLQAGDTIEMEIEGLGVLLNSIEKENSEFSIIAKES